MEYKNQIYTKDDPVATIMFNRPERRNAHDIESYNEFLHAMRDALGDSAIRVIVLTGAGTAWSAGRDIKFTNRATPQEIAQYQSILSQVFDLVRTCDKPVIARINGPITGGTNRLAFECCDISVAVNTARFARREINTGLSGGAAHFHAIGRNRCIDMNLTGRFITADEAQQWGLLTRSVPPEKLDEVVQDYIEMLVKLPPMGVAITKRCINFALESAGYSINRQFQGAVARVLWTSEDRNEAERAFIEKRTGVYKGK